MEPGIGLPCGHVVGSPSRSLIACLDRLADDVLPAARLVVGLGPRQLQDVGEETLGETVAAHDPFAELLTRRGQRDAVGGGDQPLRLEALHHLAHRRAADLQPLGDAGLDDLDVVFAEFVDALAVFLEGRMVLSLGWHGRSVPLRTQALRPDIDRRD